MALQNYVSHSEPTVKAAWLNAVDTLLVTVFNTATTVSLALNALGFSTVTKAFVAAADAAAARLVIDAAPLDNPVFTTRIKVPDGLVSAPSIIGSDPDTGLAFTDSGQAMRLGTNSTEAIVIKSAHTRFGGGGDPASLVHIKQSANVAGGVLAMERSDNTNKCYLLIDASNNFAVINNAGQFFTFDGDRFALNGETIPFQKSYAPADQVITAGGPLTLTHGLGTTPDFVDVALVNVSAEHGYNPGDILQLGEGIDASNNRGVQVIRTPTAVAIIFGSAAASISILSTSGTGSNITNNKWNLRIKAYA